MTIHIHQWHDAPDWSWGKARTMECLPCRSLLLVYGARCIFDGCVATWEHTHGGFPGGYTNPNNPTGSPIPFAGPDPDPSAVRDYNGAVLP